MSTCYAITEGSHSDYSVIAVFTTRELAEAELPKYGSHAEIEEFPLDPVVPPAPAGMVGFCCYFMKCTLDIIYHRVDVVDMQEYPIGEVMCTPNHGNLWVRVWARDGRHAIKIASEKFTQYRAIQAGAA
jgi:hypothetical protein